MMAGGRRVTRQRGRGRGKTPSPVAAVTSPKTSKKARASDPIDISSIIRESNPTTCGKDEKGSQSVKNQQGVDEAWMKNSVEEIRDVVTDFTHFMMNNVQGQAGYTRLVTAGGTPRASSVNNRTEPESIVARLTPSTGRVTNSAPSM